MNGIALFQVPDVGAFPNRPCTLQSVAEGPQFMKIQAQ
jgi:hypothetical protein